MQTFRARAPALRWNRMARLKRLGADLLRSPCEVQQFQAIWNPSDLAALEASLGEQPERTLIAADSWRTDGRKSGLVSDLAGSVITYDARAFAANLGSLPHDILPRLLGQQFGFSAFQVNLPGAPDSLFVNAQFHPSDRSLRLAQIIELADILLFHPRGNGLPLVMTLSLEAAPGSLELALLEKLLLLRSAFAEAHGGYGESCTECASNRLLGADASRFSDFILFRSSPDFTLSTAESLVNLTGAPGAPLSDHYGLRSAFQWELRDPEYLLTDDPTVLARKTQALRAVEDALEQLQKDGRKTVKPALRLLKKYQAYFSGDLPETMQRLFRLR